MRSSKQDIYLDKLMGAVGSMRQSEVLSVVLEMAVHLAADDIRQQVPVSATAVREQRVDSAGLMALAVALNRKGIPTPGLTTPEEDVLMDAWGDDDPIPFTPTSPDVDDDLTFPMGDD